MTAAEKTDPAKSLSERLREALEAIIRRDRVHGIDPNSKSERQVWFDGPCAEIARAALSPSEGE